MKRYAAICVLSLLAGCGAGVKAPAVNAVDPVASNVLQFSVGVATISQNNGTRSARGLNTVETLRQSNGLSGLLYDVPTITGPTSFSVAASTTQGVPLVASSQDQTPIGNGGLDAGADFGTNRISSATLNDGEYITFFGGPGATQGLRPTSAGAFGYGLCACNASSAPTNGVPQLFVAYSLPIYGGENSGLSDNVAQYYGGPPAFPAVSPEIAQAGFVGYPTGFVDFAVAPVLGTYRLDVAIPPDIGGTPISTTPLLWATAQLTSSAGLPVFATPSFSSDNAGGGSISVNVPVGASEAMIFVKAKAMTQPATTACATTHASTSFYTFLVSSSGPHTVQLPDALGAPDRTGKATATLCSQERFAVYAAAFDYPAYESAYPMNLAQAPIIAAPSGQADVSTSDIFLGAY